jgi:hypothetical protein
MTMREGEAMSWDSVVPGRRRRAAALCAAALLAVLPALPAGATDEIGLFFDTQAEQPCLEAGSFTTLATYLILVQPSASSGVSGWECAVRYDNATFTSCTLAGTALNVFQAPDFQVGLSPSLPWAQDVLLAQLNFVSGGAGPVRFYVEPCRIPSIPGTPVYADGADPSILLPMAPRTLGGGSGPVAGVNLPECTPESATWGQVKTTFR